VAQEDAFVSSSRRHRHRPPGIQILFSDYDDADRERGSFDHRVVDAAVTARLRVGRGQEIKNFTVGWRRVIAADLKGTSGL
jgi:hypothetical protein